MIVRSHPTWVRGLKQRTDPYLPLCYGSHPTWVRGLKHNVIDFTEINSLVAPYVGAWIETNQYGFEMQEVESHPTWVRGLKHNRDRVH